MFKINNQLLILLLLFILNIPKLYSQSAVGKGQVNGKIIDEKSAPVIYAAVGLLNAADSTKFKVVISDVNGSFNFTNISDGNYLITVEWMGYEKKFTSPFTLDAAHPVQQISNINMVPDTRQLQTVSITGKKPLIERKNDKLIMNVANSILATGNSALEILSKAPGVTVDNNGNISLRGKAGISIMIDNKQTYLSSAQLTSLLRSTDGSAIQTIELMTNPSAKYDAAGTGGIINIRMKKNTSYGTNGTVTVGGGYGKNYKSNAGLTLNHRAKNINIFGNYNYTNNKELEDLIINRSTTADNQKTYFDQQGKHNILRKNNSYKAGIDYNLSDKSILGFMASGYVNSERTNNDINTLIGSRPFGVDSSVIADNRGKSRYRSQTYNLNYKSVIDTLGQELNADVDYSIFHNSNDITYNNYFSSNLAGVQGKAPLIFRNSTPTDVKIWAGKIDYTYPVNPKMKLETGAKSSYVSTDNNFKSEGLQNGVWVNDASSSNRFAYKEQVNAAYVNLHKEFKSTTLQVGLRSELTHSEGNSITLQSVVKRNYIDFFPSVFVNQNLSKDNEIGFSYSRRIDRPDYQSLNPFIYFADLYTFSKGNPLLNPQYANAFELTYGYMKTTNVTFGYTHTKDVMTTTTITDTIKKTLLLYEQNLASRSTTSLNVSRPVAITAWWNTNNDATLYYSRFSSPDLLGAPFKSGKLTFLINTVHTFVISPSVSAELSADYVSSQVYGTYVARPMHGIDLGISKSFADKRANLKLAVNDVFDQRKLQIRSAITMQDYNLSQKQESRVFRLTFSYNFGSSVIKGIRERSNGSSSEQRRVKSGN